MLTVLSVSVSALHNYEYPVCRLVLRLKRKIIVYAMLLSTHTL
jgi:hypothetical protein